MFSNLVRLLVAGALITPAALTLELPAHLGVLLVYSLLIAAVVWSSLFHARGGAR